MDAPKIPCKCCGNILTAEWQTPIVKTKPGFWILTCDTQGCLMFAQTFSEGGYGAVNPADYACKTARA